MTYGGMVYTYGNPYGITNKNPRKRASQRGLSMDASPHTAASRFSRVTRLVLCCSLVAPSLCHAALIDRGGGLIYDTDLNITWLADTNYGAGSRYDTVDGYTGEGMRWQNAVDWAADLRYYDNVRAVTYSDWRLPTTLQPDDSCSIQGVNSKGYHCTGSELGHLFYVDLGAVEGQSILTAHNSNYSLFTNVYGGFWSGTAYAADPTTYAWAFFTHLNHQGPYYNQQRLFAWAVRDGDVYAPASSVPIPTSLLLFCSGLLGILPINRKPATQPGSGTRRSDPDIAEW